jgi:hypothetical protein
MKKKLKTIKIAILASEPLGWGSGKHYFPMILDDYSWDVDNKKYTFVTEYIYDKDIRNGSLSVSNYDVLLVPGGGVGDGEAISKGFTHSFKNMKWKEQIQKFVKDGGGYIGICGGAALFTGLDTGKNGKPKTFLEKLYDKSSLNLSAVKHFYNHLAFPLLYPFQYKHPQNVGATGYVFSFSPGETKDEVLFHSGGVPVDFKILKDNPIFSDYSGDTLRIRWWGGPAITLPERYDRFLKVCASYPKNDFSTDEKTRIFAWSYRGGFYGLFRSFFSSLVFIKKEKLRFKDIFMYIYFFAKPWKKSDKIIDLDFSCKPSITIEEYPNEHKGRIVLCTSHPEYMIWWDGYITEVKETKEVCLGTGFHKWKEVKPFSNDLIDEFTYTWWIVRRFAAWAGKVSDKEMPPIEKGKINEIAKKIIKENIYWDKTLITQMKNI